MDYIIRVLIPLECLQNIILLQIWQKEVKRESKQELVFATIQELEVKLRYNKEISSCFKV